MHYPSAIYVSCLWGFPCYLLFVWLCVKHNQFLVNNLVWCWLFVYAGISLKTQELYAIVFATRYLDLFTHYVSLYNTLMKIIFLVSSFSIVWYMRRHKIVRRSYDKDQDTFRHYLLIVPCFLIALVINEKFTFKEVMYSYSYERAIIRFNVYLSYIYAQAQYVDQVMWAFSLYLEAVAILPQLVLLQRTRNIDNLTGQYVFLLG